VHEDDGDAGDAVIQEGLQVATETGLVYLRPHLQLKITGNTSYNALHMVSNTGETVVR